ncbi:hypothetical protein [Xylophilus sp. GOD-11R]|uniref:hypothetical protein n=1 Tax=Xylophilus sp. GOD-11R TaxID=3089814 RepID=UPI00298CC261|nr:hypothetical protein [Xylophilus sp. GOD-11R]WPB58010.1 hypothetical protein R9X41_05025 [Xylophilus sp. GOD-11R]
MKRFVLLAALAAAVALPALAQKAEHHHHPRHGGVVVEGKEADFELVARPDALQLYLADHGKSIDLTEAAAKITLLSGSDKQEVVLRPAGDKLEAQGAFKVGAGTKAVAVVTQGARTLGTARFTLK